MSDTKGQHEPSMEEILASIRRIIAEDGEPSDAPGGSATGDGKPDSSPISAPPSPAAAVASPGDSKEDDVLELTEVIEEDPPVTSSADDTPSRHLEEPVFKIDPEPHAAPAGDAGAESEHLLSSTSAAASIAALSQLVARRERDKSGEMPLGAVDRTLEDVVRELLRPLLKEWLDAQLPQLVERLVQDEIAQLVRQAQGR
ncbi:MAG TPA: DUF2497 domain-containing protein [Stellaceae bacterium]|nr:DUF2497 domain-containing protein [Stellaceae bacterium]